MAVFLFYLALIIKILSSFEKTILNKSKKILCLTKQSINILSKKYPNINYQKFICIRTGVNPDTFQYVPKTIDFDNIIFRES